MYIFIYIYNIADSDIDYISKKWKEGKHLIRNKSSYEIWLPHLNLGFTEMQIFTNNKQICDATVNFAMFLTCKETPTFNIQSATLPTSLLTLTSSVQTIHIHHISKGHFVTSSSLRK